MIPRLSGAGGSLFPSAFLSQLSTSRGFNQEIESARVKIATWWKRTDARCGPATGLHALFDLAAMPLAALLGYRAHDAEFHQGFIRVRLAQPNDGSQALTMVVLPWASRPARRWKDLDSLPQGSAGWGIVLAPPFISIVNMRGHAFRRSVDFRFPEAIDPRTFPVFWTIAHAANLLTPAGDALVIDAGRFQDAVRDDLQTGVVRALASLKPVVGPFDEALTIVYRVLFLLFAESRALAPSATVRRSAPYAITSLCRDASIGGDRRLGLWDGLAAVTRLSRQGADAADFRCQAFNGRLFSRRSAPSLEAGGAARPTRRSLRRDSALGDALIALGTRPGAGGREEITYADLGVEQLGAVYERVLDLDTNALEAGSRASAGTRGHSARRKETGTFYTPRALAEFVVRRTLAPLVEHATTDAILSLRVVDPSMGSGAFLVAACRYLSDAYERALVDEGRCAETDLDADARARIRRLVASRCLAGVDANPVAVQLARLSLWLTTLARDKPLSFFDHQLRCGDSLVGCSPDDLWRLSMGGGRAETPLFDAAGLESAIRSIAQPWRQLRQGGDDTVRDVRERERVWSSISGDDSLLARWRRACDLWCMRWFDKDARTRSAPEFRALIDAALRGDRSRHTPQTRGFFHWPIEFTDLFYEEDGTPKARPGFDAVIGNPPWEMLRGQGPGRRELVSFIRGSGLYPACDRGHVNLYQPFLERSLSLVRPGGRVGLVLPWGLASDEGGASLRRLLFERGRVDTIVGLDNSAGLFPIHRGLRFMVVVASPGAAPRATSATFGVRTPEEIDGLPGRDDPEASTLFEHRLDAGTLRVVGGPSLRIPDVRRPGDLDWLAVTCRRFPALGSPSGWNLRFGRELNATEDRDAFGSTGLPVIEGKHIGPFTVDVAASSRRITPEQLERLLPGAACARARLAYRDVAGVGNRRTLIAAIVPSGVVTTHTLFCLRGTMDDERQNFLCALFNSAPLDRIVRMLMGGHVTTGLIEHLPVPIWSGDDDQKALARLAVELAGTKSGENERALIEQEIDARAWRLYA